MRYSALVIVFFTTSALAQTGSIIDHRAANIPAGKTLGIAEKRHIMQDFAACTVRRWRHGVERYLDTVPESVEAQTMGARLATEDCLISGQMQFQEALYRAAAYEAMYRVTFARQGVSDFTSVPPIDYAQPGAPTDEAASARATLRRLADCAVRHGPLEARAHPLADRRTGRKRRLRRRHADGFGLHARRRHGQFLEDQPARLCWRGALSPVDGGAGR